VTTEEPELYVQVAEALGWTDIQPCGNIMLPDSSFYDGRPPGAVVIIGWPQEGRRIVPRYDIDWSATGPILERLGIGVQLQGRWSTSGVAKQEWVAEAHWPTYQARYVEFGPTPQIAVCNLILDLARAGRMEG
jgi:hypothetical protein